MNFIYYYWDSEIFYKGYIQSDVSIDYSVERGEMNQTLSALPTFSYLVCNAPHLICSFRGEFYLWKGLIILKKNVQELLVFIYNGHTDSLTIPTHVKQICFQDFQIFLIGYRFVVYLILWN